MANSAEDLEFNPFFKALQTRFLSLYERAQQNCWLVCIPTADSLETCNMSKQFVERHLLEPSVLLRDVYGSLGSKLAWRLDENFLHNESHDYKVKVLAEELAYNKSLKQFKMFIIDRPLDPSYKLKEPGALKDRVRGSQGMKDVLERKRSYEDHKEFLDSFQCYREGIEELNRQIRLFKQNYLVVEVESLLLDTATKLEWIVRQGITGFLEANKQDTKLQDRRVSDACCLSIERLTPEGAVYLMHHVCSKVYPAVCRVHEKYDRQLRKRCQLLRGKLTPSAVGVSEDYECRYPLTLAHLRLIDTRETPLEILYTLQDAMDSIMVDVKDNFTRCLRIGEPAAMASDDLISVVAILLMQVDCKCLVSALYYVEHFHWFSESDQLSYILVTCRAAVEFLRGPEVNKWLPDNQSQQTKSQVSSTFPESPSETTGLDTNTNQSQSQSTSKDSVQSTRISSLSPTLLAQLRISATEEQQKPHPKPGDDLGLGPFLSRLLESDQVVTSTEYDGKYN